MEPFLVDSTVGEGSTFLVQLPLAESAEEVVQNESQHTSSSQIRKGRILLAEDNKMNIDLMKMLMSSLQQQDIEIAENGAVAVELFKKGNYDLVLMDCQMPEMDGFEATAEIRRLEQDKARKTPIVAMTANAMKGDRERCLQLGMDDYLTKPVTIQSVETVLAKWMPDSTHGVEMQKNSLIITVMSQRFLNCTSILIPSKCCES